MDQYIIETPVIIGIINQLKAYVPKLTGLVGFVVALILGTAFGFLHWFGLSGIEAGFTAGLISSGAYTVAKRLGGN